MRESPVHQHIPPGAAVPARGANLEMAVRQQICAAVIRAIVLSWRPGTLRAVGKEPKVLSPLATKVLVRRLGPERPSGHFASVAGMHPAEATPGLSQGGGTKRMAVLPDEPDALATGYRSAPRSSDPVRAPFRPAPPSGWPMGLTDPLPAESGRRSVPPDGGSSG